MWKCNTKLVLMVKSIGTGSKGGALGGDKVKKNISKMLHKIATEEENLLKSPNVDGGTPPLASEM